MIMYLCVHAYVCACIYVCKETYIHESACMDGLMDVDRHVCVCAWMDKGRTA